MLRCHADAGNVDRHFRPLADKAVVPDPFEPIPQHVCRLYVGYALPTVRGQDISIAAKAILHCKAAVEGEAFPLLRDAIDAKRSGLGARGAVDPVRPNSLQLLGVLAVHGAR